MQHNEYSGKRKSAEATEGEPGSKRYRYDSRLDSKSESEMVDAALRAGNSPQTTAAVFNQRAAIISASETELRQRCYESNIALENALRSIQDLQVRLHAATQAQGQNAQAVAAAEVLELKNKLETLTTAYNITCGNYAGLLARVGQMHREKQVVDAKLMQSETKHNGEKMLLFQRVQTLEKEVKEYETRVQHLIKRGKFYKEASRQYGRKLDEANKLVQETKQHAKEMTKKHDRLQSMSRQQMAVINRINEEMLELKQDPIQLARLQQENSDLKKKLQETTQLAMQREQRNVQLQQALDERSRQEAKKQEAEKRVPEIVAILGVHGLPKKDGFIAVHVDKPERRRTGERAWFAKVLQFLTRVSQDGVVDEVMRVQWYEAQKDGSYTVWDDGGKMCQAKADSVLFALDRLPKNKQEKDAFFAYLEEQMPNCTHVTDAMPKRV